MTTPVDTRHLRNFASILHSFKDEVRAVNVTGRTITVIFRTSEAATKLGEMLRLVEITDHPGNFQGPSGDNFYYLLVPDELTIDVLKADQIEGKTE